MNVVQKTLTCKGRGLLFIVICTLCVSRLHSAYAQSGSRASETAGAGMSSAGSISGASMALSVAAIAALAAAAGGGGSGEASVAEEQPDPAPAPAPAPAGPVTTGTSLSGGKGFYRFAPSGTGASSTGK